jgi:hypothetical protein
MAPSINLDKDALQFSWATAAKVVMAVLGGLGTLIAFVVWLTTLRNEVTALSMKVDGFIEETRYHWRVEAGEYPVDPPHKGGLAPTMRLGRNP